IATPTSSHYTVAYEFLKRGICVLIEKPFTVSLWQANQLIKLAKKNNLILQVGHVERFNSAFCTVQKIIKNPRFIECHRLSNFPKRSLDVGVVLDLMIHDIDIILSLVNSEIKKIEAVGVNVLTPFEDIANARISFENGCICNLTASRISDEVVRKIRIFTDKFYISLDYKQEEAFLYKRIGSEIIKEVLPIEREEPLKRELNHFIECVLYQRRPLVPGEIAKEVLSVALKIQRKIWKNKKF
ncbi:MAG: Gfo/Idh/MocA family oxidoreductase, partial [Candidatus Omnitrophica bacterium]|nr:Gfo/Idh/MocA family oxidoreductase [Candidatus Omnitrophota bacterium]